MKNKVKIVESILFAFTVIMLNACQKDVDDTLNDNVFPNKTVVEEGEIVLGQKLNDPYDMKFITQAFRVMEEDGAVFPFGDISPTGMYVRLLAKTSDELDAIEADTNTLWFDFPLDYDISEGGEYYHDPSLPDTATWKYAVVPVNYEFPSGIVYEIIHYVFIPDEHPDYDRFKDVFDRLEEYSEILCGNRLSLADEEKYPPASKSVKWSPSVTIKAWDNVKDGLIPLQGVKVTVRHYTKCRSGITDFQGKCTFNKEFKVGHRVTYGITWERANWDIRNAWGSQQYYNGPKLKTAWTLNIYGQKQLMFATMHRALYKAFYGYWGGINRPYSTHKLKVGYLDSYSDKTLAWNICTWNVIGVMNNISVHGRDSNGNFLVCSDMFGNLTHELGHQSMLRFVGGTWNYAIFSYNDFIRESYANCVEWYITNHHYYNDLGVNGYCYRYHYQWWKNLGEKSSYYTPVFIDLIDDSIQIHNVDGYKDNISGYTLLEIQNLLIESSFGLHSLRETLKNNLLHGTTIESVDELMDNYSNTGF